MQKGLFHHQVLNGNRAAIERKGNWFYWSPGNNTFQTVEQQVQGFSIGNSSQYAHISVHNAWPEDVDNVSLFESLCKPAEARTEFDRLIAQNYKLACAIIYRSGSKSHIIGTGGRLNNGIVITAKHLYRELDFKDLYVRFFHFNVERDYGRYVVYEDYIDIPILGAVDSGWGYDVGFLDVPTLSSWSLHQKYIRGAALYNNQFGQPLPDGRYLLFHFAGGFPQVSIGNLAHDMANASSLQNIIGLQAGPGASGGMLLWCSLSGALSAAGISVYRSFLNGIPERHLVSFDDLNESPLFRGKEAPYYYNPNFSIFRSHSIWEDDGYEYLRWFAGFYGENSGNADDKPDDEYFRLNVPPGFQYHHIVQKIDIYWLYQHFYEYKQLARPAKREEYPGYRQKLVKRIPPKLAKDITDRVSQLDKYSNNTFKRRVREAVTDYYSADEHGQAYIVQQEIISKEMEEDKSRDITDELLLSTDGRYRRVHEKINQLCHPLNPGKSSFCWGFWNLFKGPKSRSDDPKNNEGTRCEKNRPKSFDPTLWGLLTDEQEGLDASICVLKDASTKNNDEHLIRAENIVYQSLSRIQNYWLRKTGPNPMAPQPHNYNDNDWEVGGEEDGVTVYKLKL
ncbi:MAG: hypothetical protein K2X50_07650 [Gammaproteobacteria bacterium]|nr:hypothetical protein [Gammaproteobacteria bacterium]